MANADVISAVSASLEARLTEALSTLGPPAPTAKLHDLVTPVASDQPTVTLFLYEIAEDPSVHNRAQSRHEVNGELRLRKAPIGLCLRYMVTAWGGDRHTEQRMLGRVVQVLHDDSALDGLQLAGVLAGSADQLSITLTPLQLEDRARVWSAIGQTYRLSVNYDVRLANIDAETETSLAPVRERHIGAPA